MKKRIHLAFDLSWTQVETQWRIPGSWVGRNYPDVGLFEEVARVAERGGLDMIFFGDGTGIPDVWEDGIDDAVRYGVAWPRMDMSPWIVAMSDKPGYLTTLDYARRWGIEPMFSDFKSRGFGLDDTQIRYAPRLARLVLVMALAIHWAVSTGHWDRAHHALPAEAQPRRRPPRKLARSLVSCFTRGLRRIARLMQQATPLPPLWAASG